MFWLVVLVLGLVASLFVVMPYFLRSNGVIDDRNELNVDLYRDRVSDIHDSDAENPDTLELEAKMALLEDTVLKDRISEDELSQNKGLERETDAGDVSYKEGSFKLMLGFAIAIPFFAFFVYHEAGLNQGSIPDVLIAESLDRLSPEDKDGYLKVTELIADRLESKPDDADLKFLLASAYSNQGRFEEAIVQYASLVSDFPHDASLASRYAEVVFIADGRNLTPRAAAAVDIALNLNPMDITMLEVRAIGSMMQGDTVSALKWFNLALRTGVDGRRAELIRLAVKQIESKSSERLQGRGPLARAAEPAVASVSQGTVSGEPVLVDKGAGREIIVRVTGQPEGAVARDAVVFVYARAAIGPRAPLAVQRMPFSALPVTVKLDETMAMMPGMGLANFDEVVVIARLSNSGQVVPTPGDHEARSEVLKLTDETITLNLNISEQIQ